MTTKRTPLRRASRHLSPAREVQAWKMTFTCGTDYFSDLRDIGIERVTPAQIEDAWHRLGAIFLSSWEPDSPKSRQRPWALDQWGEP